MLRRIRYSPSVYAPTGMPGTDRCPCYTNTQYWHICYRICLRARYAVPGTDLTYAAICAYARAPRWPVLRERMTLRIARVCDTPRGPPPPRRLRLQLRCQQGGSHP
eukprot:330349-Rhodomonas_salina.1